MKTYILSILLLVSMVAMATASDSKGLSSWFSSDKKELMNRAISYMKGLYKSYQNGRGARNIFGEGDGDDDELLLLLLLGGAAIFLPLILGGLALAAIIPFIGTTLNPLNTAGALTTGVNGLTGTVPTITANTINPGRRRRDISGLGFQSKLLQGLDNLVKTFDR